ncbi:hypothetical protein [Desertivibrio insolitus]|uniref:hypothetical protein n=1 Tax=Herbiconiux sp. SYSU D00978 TaxID=2812562 RepID=UPI001A95F8EF|nr:hypothetical protein [Herbiconiux sp. SYSU D00978]
MAAAVIAVSILDIVGLLVAAGLGVAVTSPVLVLLPAAGLPIGMLLLVAVTVLMAVRRRRETRESAG